MSNYLRKILNKKVIIGAAIVAFIIVGGIVVKVKFFPKTEQVQNTVRYTSLSKRNLSSSISTSGNIKSGSVSDVSSSLDTSVKQINVKVGDTVKAGDVLAVMDTTDLETEIANLQAQVDKNVQSAKSALESKKSAYESAKVAYNNSLTNTSSTESSSEVSSHITLMASSSSGQSKNGSDSNPGNSNTQNSPSNSNSSTSSSSNSNLSPQEALEKAKTEYENALTEYENAGSSTELDNKKAQLSKAQIVAPADGVVTAVNAVVGEKCTSSLFEVQDLNSLIVNVNVSENDISKVKTGEKASIVVDAADGAELEGEVTSVSPVSTDSTSSSSSSSGSESSKGGSSSAGAGSAGGSSSSSSSNVTYAVQIKVNTQNENVKVGMTAVTNIILEENDDVFAVPYESIVQEGNSKYIYVAEEENGKYVVKEVPVTEGMESDIYVEIDGSELKEGMKVLGNPSQYEVGSTVDISAQSNGKGQKSGNSSNSSKSGSSSSSNGNGGPGGDGNMPQGGNGAPPDMNK